MLDSPLLLQFYVGVENVLQLLQEPLVNLCEVVDLVDGVAAMKGFLHHQYTLISWCLEGSFHIVNFQLLIADKTMKTLSDHAKPLLDSLFEGATDCHHFTH